MARTKLVVLASTFPRWEHDNVPSFVLEFARHMAPHVAGVTAIVPHFLGAKRREKIAPDIQVKRFRYVYPYKFENLAYGQFEKTTFYPLKAALYAASELWTTLVTCFHYRRQVVINAHWVIPQGFVAVLVAPIVSAKVVVSVHGADVFTLNGHYMRKVKRFVLQHADVVVANSSVTQAECLKLWPHRQYPVVPMGIDTETFKPATGQATHRSRDYTVLFVGRLAPSKGVHYLCEAVARVHEKHPDIHLDIIGDGPERIAIEEFIKERRLANAISLLGWVQHDDLPTYYHASDVFIGPSVESEAGRKEAFGLVFAEASATGLPVITTNAGGMTDIIKDTETGLIVPQKDADAIRAALEYLYRHRDEGRAMGAKGSRFVREHYSWENTTQRYLQLLGF